ncbi:MAG: hypothetical protein WAL60_22980 [Candidatus Sulfotelmatobacter sp.]
MSLVRLFRKGSRGLITYRAAVMCVATLGIFCGRVTPPSFVPASVSVSTHTDHDRRHYFDHEDSQWAAAPSAALNAPPPVASSEPVRASEFLLELVTDGWHYNRPPPIS